MKNRKLLIPLLAISILIAGGLMTSMQTVNAQLLQEMSIPLPEPTTVPIDDPVIVTIFAAFQHIGEVLGKITDAVVVNSIQLEALNQTQHLGNISCSTDQIVRFDGSNWGCSEDRLVPNITSFNRYAVFEGNSGSSPIQVMCNAGDIVLSGGTHQTEGAYIISNGPVVGAEGWQVGFVINDLETGTTVTAVAYCLDLP